MFIAIAVSLVAGALATSAAEYKFNYNLVDYIIEGVKKILGLVAKAESAVVDAAKAAEKAVKDKL